MTALTVTERPATRDDLEAVTGLYCAYDAAVRGFVDTEPSDVLRDWDEPGFDLTAGTLVLEADGRVVGYAVRSGRDADSVVDLSLRDAGLEDRLLAWLEAFDAPHARPKRNPEGRATRGSGVRRSSLTTARSLAPFSFAATTSDCGKTPSLIEGGP